MEIRKIYKVSVVGTLKAFHDCCEHPLVHMEKNVIESNEEQALNYCIKNFDRVLSKTVKFNLKETIKLFVLDILGLKSFKISFDIEKGRIENDR